MSLTDDPKVGAEGCKNRTQTRRRLLVSVGATGAVAISGCLGMFEEPEEREEPEEQPPEEDDTTDDEEEPSDTTDDVFEVEFLEFDTVLEIDQDPDQTLLYEGLDEGWDLPYACEVGSCGQCTARYDGDANDVIRHDGNEYLDDEQIEDGWFLTCVAYAEDDFAMETNVHPDDESETFEVEFLEFDTVLEIDQDPEQALLYDGLDEGWDLPYACESGTCGQCTARYDGDANDVIRHEGNEYLDDEQIEDGWFLTCVGYAEDDFAMETNVHPDDEE